MRIFPILLSVWCMAATAWGQTNTNHYAPKAADMRIVEGKMYNRALNTNWTTLPTKGATLEVVDTVAEGVVVKSSGNSDASKMVIKHPPGEKNLTKGKTIKTPFRAMSVAGVKYGNETLAAYDCGLANTKENRKTLKSGPVQAAQ